MTTTRTTITLDADNAATRNVGGNDNPHAAMRPGDVIVGAEDMGEFAWSRHLYNPTTGACDDVTMVMMYFRTPDGATNHDAFGVPQTFDVIRNNR